jgi:hypothetical protein
VTTIPNGLDDFILTQIGLFPLGFTRMCEFLPESSLPSSSSARLPLRWSARSTRSIGCLPTG